MNNTQSQVQAPRQGPVLAKAVTKRILVLQCAAAVITALVFVVFQGYWSGVAVLFGGAVSIITALMLSRGVKKAGAMALQDPGKSMAVLYVGAVQRFLVVAGLLALGLGVLKLSPIPLCIGFAIAQLSYVISTRKG